MIGTIRVKFDRTIKKTWLGPCFGFSVTTGLEQAPTLVLFVLMKNILKMIHHLAL
ncbi:hypothetical protein BCV72DRAFT_219521 [Rhizopus microsporus var. microsporus]|uniref:Uncharacterized protein n=1 Tax=Rhizopus microsporus var. microsporus TaxID=86635 RepID=A0A1X0RI98_RHIZD|nr:hypothetical protein BCV72DRAFT_219521 [Rhizopus microsporus var. microsporus]